jgi:hypothetical protein
VKKQRSKEAEKQRSKEAEQWRSKEAGKGRKAEKHNINAKQAGKHKFKKKRKNKT